MNDEFSVLSGLAGDMALALKQSLSKRMLKASTVARRSKELAREAWIARESLVRQVADNAVFFLLDGGSADEVRSLCRKSASDYSNLMQMLDFRMPVVHLWSVAGRDVENAKRHVGKSFVGLKKGRWGQQYIVYLRRLEPMPYEAECALSCAVIAQDWSLAESLARNIPIPLSAKTNADMNLSLLRYTVLGRKSQVEERCKNYSSRASGIDFSPRRPDFALAIVRRDEKLLAKAFNGTAQSFREKWRLEKYVTPRMLRRYGTPEAVKAVAARELCGLRWAYSSWAVAMMCIAMREGLNFTSRKSSNFIPQVLFAPIKEPR